MAEERNDAVTSETFRRIAASLKKLANAVDEYVKNEDKEKVDETAKTREGEHSNDNEMTDAIKLASADALNPVLEDVEKPLAEQTREGESEHEENNKIGGNDNEIGEDNAGRDDGDGEGKDEEGLDDFDDGR